MPTQEAAFLNQKAVLWEHSGSFDSNGDPLVLAAVEIDTHWEQVRRASIGDDNAPLALDARAIVSRDIAEHSVMWLGKLAGLPAEPDDLHEVIKFDKIADIKGREFQRTVHLRRWKQPLPTIEA